MDGETRKRAQHRIKIIGGQVRGIERMIDEGSYCVDVLTQISAVHEALRGVGKVIVRNHLETCVTEGLQGDDRQHHYDELMDLIYKWSK